MLKDKMALFSNEINQKQIEMADLQEKLKQQKLELTKEKR